MNYQIVYSNRKTIAIVVTVNNEIIVKAPRHLSRKELNRYVEEKQSWIESMLQQNQINYDEFLGLSIQPEEIIQAKQQAKQIITKKVEVYARQLGVTYGSITIRSQKTRWGSCSSKGNLNFNWKICLAPEGVINYLVVHELAHRKEMNHSKNFYRVIATILPNYQESEQWLKQYGKYLIQID